MSKHGLQHRGLIRRSKILRSAVKLFLEKGYASTFWSASGMKESDYEEYFLRSTEADGNIYGYSFYTKGSGDVPRSVFRATLRISTASSAIRRWPRLSSSAAASLLPMPLSPMSSRPSP